MELEILGELPLGVTEDLLQKWIKTYKYPYESVALEVRFVEPEEIQFLNRMYRKKDESTDILEFPTATATKNEPVVHLGSIVVSPTDHYRKLGHDSSQKEWKALIEHGLGNLVIYHEQIS